MIFFILLFLLQTNYTYAKLPIVDAKYLNSQATFVMSPNYERRNDHQTGQRDTPSMIILHYSVSNFADSEKEFTTWNRLSSHYLIDKSSYPIQLVADNMRAYDAGVSYWLGHTDINSLSIGIEIVNDGYRVNHCQAAGVKVKGSAHEWYPFNKTQIKNLIKVIKDVFTRYKIKPRFILGHSDIAIGRKVDPGPLFPWEELAKSGIGAWPDLKKPLKKVRIPNCIDKKWFFDQLKIYGYEVNINTRCAQKNHEEEIVKAFQMHFRQKNIDGKIDMECMKIIAALIDQYT